MMLVSVIMPAYNCEKYIGEAIVSVLSQSYTHIELIIIDDNSTDNTVEVASRYASDDKRIQILKNSENMGVANTRNRGIQQAKGQYIALIDSDDIWTKDKIERQLHMAQKQQADIVYCSYGFINESGVEIKKPFIVASTTNFKKMLAKSVISCSTALITTTVLKNNPFDPNVYHEDYALWMKLLSMHIKAVGDTKVLAYYRQVSGSRSGNKFHSAIERWNIYRKVLKMGYIYSAWSFFRYAVEGVFKYYFYQK